MHLDIKTPHKMLHFTLVSVAPNSSNPQQQKLVNHVHCPCHAPDLASKCLDDCSRGLTAARTLDTGYIISVKVIPWHVLWQMRSSPPSVYIRRKLICFIEVNDRLSVKICADHPPAIRIWWIITCRNEIRTQFCTWIYDFRFAVLRQ